MNSLFSRVNLFTTFFFIFNGIFLLASVLEDTANKEWLELDKRWLEEQKREFHEMDIDGNGLLTQEELLVNDHWDF